MSEQFTIGDLENNAVSDITAKYLWDRQHGEGMDHTVLLKVEKRNNNLYVQYRSDPSYADEEQPMRVALNGAMLPTDYYDTLFEFEGVEENLGGIEEFNSLEQRQVLRDFLKDGMCRVHCSCPAFYAQGHHESMAQIGATIFKFPGPKGDGVWQGRHAAGLKVSGISICKHLAAAIPRILGRDFGSILKQL